MYVFYFEVQSAKVEVSMSQLRICCNPKGPIIVEGEADLVDKYGRPLGNDKRKKMHVLCGCGKSLTRPFCDGAHNAPGESDEDDND
jgi:CDGSH-type Zn-finger protein